MNPERNHRYHKGTRSLVPMSGGRQTKRTCQSFARRLRSSPALGILNQRKSHRLGHDPSCADKTCRSACELERCQLFRPAQKHFEDPHDPIQKRCDVRLLRLLSASVPKQASAYRISDSGRCRQRNAPTAGRTVCRFGERSLPMPPRET